MAASVTRPPVSICRYDPMFKVDVLLHSPLHEHVGVKHEHKMELMSLCLSLDSLIVQETLKHPDHKYDTRKSGSFDDKAGVVTNTMQQVVNKSFNSIPCSTFLQESGMDRLFPNVASLVSHPEGCAVSSGKSAVQNYFSQLSSLNHVLGVARQINHDISHNTNIKYLAHQISVLYQALNNIPNGGNVFSRHLKNIEENFQVLKNSITELSDTDYEGLPSEVRDWVVEITDSIIDGITSLPSDLTQELLPVTSVLLRGM